MTVGCVPPVIFLFQQFGLFQWHIFLPDNFTEKVRNTVSFLQHLEMIASI